MREDRVDDDRRAGYNDQSHRTIAVYQPQPKRSELPFAIRIEPRLSTPRWLSPVVTIAAVVIALLLGMVVLLLVGGDPIAAYKHIGEAAFGDLGVFSDTLVKATPLILIGLGCSLAFRMKLWNIGAEGQFYIGALAASALPLTGLITDAWPGRWRFC